MKEVQSFFGIDLQGEGSPQFKVTNRSGKSVAVYCHPSRWTAPRRLVQDHVLQGRQYPRCLKRNRELPSLRWRRLQATPPYELGAAAARALLNRRRTRKVSVASLSPRPTKRSPASYRRQRPPPQASP